jgi:endonuclease/exonuclease/phosphatase family metal-dependent hydrolase
MLGEEGPSRPAGGGLREVGMRRSWTTSGVPLAALSSLLALGQLGCGGSGPATELTVMTFNVLCSFCDPAYDPWDERLPDFGDILARHQPDLVGLQELTWPEEVADVLALQPGFEAVHYRGDEPGPFGLTDYPDAAILFRSERFTLLEKGFYWLSPTPDEPWSTGWADGLQFARIATWARLEERRTGRELVFVTTHFDNNAPNQEHSAPLLLERTAPWADLPVIVTGDFNSQPADEAYRILTQGSPGSTFRLRNAFDFAASWSVDTNQAPPPDYDPDSRIDHVFTAGDGADWTCPSWTADLHVYGPGSKYPSDHFPIAARLRLE